MADLTFKDIRKAMKQIERYYGTPARFYCSESMGKKLMAKAKELGVKAETINGNDYLMGMKLITHPDLDDMTCYISGKDGEDGKD